MQVPKTRRQPLRKPKMRQSGRAFTGNSTGSMKHGMPQHLHMWMAQSLIEGSKRFCREYITGCTWMYMFGNRFFELPCQLVSWLIVAK